MRIVRGHDIIMLLLNKVITSFAQDRDQVVLAFTYIHMCVCYAMQTFFDHPRPSAMAMKFKEKIFTLKALQFQSGISANMLMAINSSMLS